MSALDGLMLSAQSQPRNVHFKNQRALILRAEGDGFKTRVFPVHRSDHPPRGTARKTSGPTPIADC